MASTSIAHPAQPVPAPAEQPGRDLEHASIIAARVLRGQALYREHADEIRLEDAVWLVPSQHDATSVYEVVIGRRGESCECEDFEHRGTACKHIHAAIIAKAKTAPCSGCGQRCRRRDLVEVQESLTYFEGDLLCHGCWHSSDAEVL